jgi:Putative DNA-binding domain
MRAAFHYEVKVNIIHPKSNGFTNSFKVFEHENPIIAREEAFNHYQSYIDVLLGTKKNITDKQTRIELTSFIDPGTSYRLWTGKSEIEISDSFGKGIGVFMVIDEPLEDTDKVGEEIIIHGIGRIHSADDPQSLMDGLNHEYQYYNHYGYDVKNYKQTIDFCEDGESESEPNEILKTPFDWTGFDKPQSEGDSHETKKDEKETITVEQLIKSGESNQVEFKPTLLFNFSTGKAGIGIKGIIAKAICAFLNSREGGYLLIGVTDKGEIQGLEHDYSLANGKNPKDFFLLEFDQMISHFLSFAIKSDVKGQFYELEAKEIFIVAVSPSKNRPIFLNGQQGKEFYVRGEASSQQLTDIEKIVNYCIDRWTN